MPQLGPAFLHRPISGDSLRRIEDAAAWLAAGLRASIPEKLRAFGWQPETALYACDGSGEFKSSGLRERSWLGEYRIGSDAVPAESLPATIVLSPSLVFETTVDLPNAARSTLDKTVALRMSEISPIPPEEAAFAIGETMPPGDARFRASVAIVRKETLQQVHAAFPEGTPVAIGAAPRADGFLAYMFERRGDGSKDAIRNLLLAGLALWASLLLLAGAVEARQERALAALDAHQAELREEVRALKVMGDTVARTRLAPQQRSLAGTYQLLAEAMEALPRGSVVLNISVTGDRVAISGFAPAAGAEADHLPRSPSDYPGYDSFDMTTSVATPEKGS